MNFFKFFPLRIKKNSIIDSPTPVVVISPCTAPMLCFKDIFITEEAYFNVLAILRRKNCIAPHSEIWIDHQKSSKKTLISLLKLLRVQGYYKNNHTLTALEIQQIAFNSFGVTLSISHIEHTSYDSSDINYIPTYLQK